MQEAGGARIGPKNGCLLLVRQLGKERGLHAILLSVEHPLLEKGSEQRQVRKGRE